MDNSHNLTALVLSYVFERPKDDMVAAEAAVFRRLRETVAHLSDDTPDVVRGVVGDRAETIVDVVFALFVLFYAPFTHGGLAEHIDEMGPDGEELAYVKLEIGGLSADPDALIPVKGRVFSQAFLVASIRHHTKRSNDVMLSKPMIERCLQFLDAAGLLRRSERRGRRGLDVMPTPVFRELVDDAILDVEAMREPHPGLWRRFRHLRGLGLAIMAALLVLVAPVDAEAGATGHSSEHVIEQVGTLPLAGGALAALEDVRQGYGRLVRVPVEPVKPSEALSWATDASEIMHLAALQDVRQGYGKLVRRPSDPVKPGQTNSYSPDVFEVVPGLFGTGASKRDPWF